VLADVRLLACDSRSLAFVARRRRRSEVDDESADETVSNRTAIPSLARVHERVLVDRLRSSEQPLTGLRIPSEAKTRALQRYRDRETEAARALEDLVARESWPHAICRRTGRKSALRLTAPATIGPVIEDWRASAAVRPVMADEAEVYDPTRFTTADLLSDVAEKPLGGPPTEKVPNRGPADDTI
jgi:hypothetical protein